MQDWQHQLAKAVTSADTLARHFGIEPDELHAAGRYPLRITPHYLGLIEAPGDPIWRQCVPDPRELEPDTRLCADPLAEQFHSPVPGVVHRHRDRALLLLSGQCPTLCRFCFRKGRSDSGGLDLTPAQLDGALCYLEQTEQIKEVILTGGEPLALDDAPLGRVLARLRRIGHVDLLRVHTRVPVVLPSRITDAFVSLLSRNAPLYLMIHVNHPAELNDRFCEACSRLADAGVVLGSQTVLLRGVNDDLRVLRSLFRGLLRLRVRPYYLHHPDPTAGTGHFRVSIEKGRRLMSRLQSVLPGLAVPHYVVDLPGGRGKVPVAGDCVESLGRTAVLRAPDGQRVEVPNEVKSEE